MWSVTVTGDHPTSEEMLRHYVQTLRLQGWVVSVVPTPPTTTEPEGVYAAVEGAD